MANSECRFGKWLGLLAAVLILGWLGTSVTLAANDGWLKVKVVNQQNECLPNAEVSATNGGEIYHQVVGPDCVAQFHLPSGSCQLNVSCDGYQGRVVRATVPLHDTATVVVTLDYLIKK